MVRLKYNSKVAAGINEDSKDIFMHGYYKIGELRYVLEADTETVIESELVVGIETLLDIIFIAL